MREGGNKGSPCSEEERIRRWKAAMAARSPEQIAASKLRYSMAAIERRKSEEYDEAGRVERFKAAMAGRTDEEKAETAARKRVSLGKTNKAKGTIVDGVLPWLAEPVPAFEIAEKTGLSVRQIYGAKERAKRRGGLAITDEIRKKQWHASHDGMKKDHMRGRIHSFEVLLAFAERRRGRELMPIEREEIKLLYLARQARVEIKMPTIDEVLISFGREKGMCRGRERMALEIVFGAVLLKGEGQNSENPLTMENVKRALSETQPGFFRKFGKEIEFIEDLFDKKRVMAKALLLRGGSLEEVAEVTQTSEEDLGLLRERMAGQGELRQDLNVLFSHPFKKSPQREEKLTFIRNCFDIGFFKNIRNWTDLTEISQTYGRLLRFADMLIFEAFLEARLAVLEGDNHLLDEYSRLGKNFLWFRLPQFEYQRIFIQSLEKQIPLVRKLSKDNPRLSAKEVIFEAKRAANRRTIKPLN